MLTREGEYFFKNMKYEWQIHEISKSLRLMSNSNMNMFDWIFSNDIIRSPPDFMNLSIENLKLIALKCIDHRFIRHTFGWTKHMYNKNWRDPKKVLHSIRPLMTCYYFLEKNEYITNIQELVSKQILHEYHQLVTSLIDLKKKGLSTNDVVRQKSLDTYENLKKNIEKRKDKIQNRSNMENYIQGLISFLRIRTLKYYKNIDMDFPE